MLIPITCQALPFPALSCHSKATRHSAETAVLTSNCAGLASSTFSAEGGSQPFFSNHVPPNISNNTFYYGDCTIPPPTTHLTTQATKEDKMEVTLGQLAERWNNVVWSMSPCKGGDVPLLNMAEEDFEALEVGCTIMFIW